MKKQMTKAIFLVLVCAMVFSLHGTAFADAGSGLELIRETGYANTITLPNPGRYLEEPATRYVNAGTKNSVFSYLMPWRDLEKIGPYPYHGSKVTVVAEQGGFDCIVYHDHKNGTHAGWVYASTLSDSFPGTECSIGTAYDGDTENLGDLPVALSKENFRDSKQKYTVLAEPVPNCVQFTLDYQVIGRNGARTEDVLGDRTVYVYDGSGWTEVGTFPYPVIDAVHVVVNLEQPMNLAAVATVADCAKPDTFLFRQSVLDVMATE